MTIKTAIYNAFLSNLIDLKAVYDTYYRLIQLIINF